MQCAIPAGAVPGAALQHLHERCWVSYPFVSSGLPTRLLLLDSGTYLLPASNDEVEDKRSAAEKDEHPEDNKHVSHGVPTFILPHEEGPQRRRFHDLWTGAHGQAILPCANEGHTTHGKRLDWPT